MLWWVHLCIDFFDEVRGSNIVAVEYVVVEYE